jgi:hypothetical protein
MWKIPKSTANLGTFKKWVKSQLFDVHFVSRTAEGLIIILVSQNPYFRLAPDIT